MLAPSGPASPPCSRKGTVQRIAGPSRHHWAVGVTGGGQLDFTPI
jgi:hypothetical protein